MDIHRVIDDTVTLLKNTLDRRIRIEVHLSATTAMVIGDQSQLQSVLLNLGINASHAMPDGGAITFLSNVLHLDEAYCRSDHRLCPGTYIEVEVRDTGCGIRPEHLPRIFEPFFTTKEQGKGTGLGLSTALGTIQQHKGTIKVYSEVGRGTSFRILLPLLDNPLVTMPPPEPLIRGKGLILLADDEPVLRATGVSILEDIGYQVITAADGAEALALFRKRPQEIDLVILDMVMPVMNGRDCFAEMQRVRPDVRAIISSGFARDEDLADMCRNGLIGFLQKPFRASLMSRMVADALRAPSPPH